MAISRTPRSTRSSTISEGGTQARRPAAPDAGPAPGELTVSHATALDIFVARHDWAFACDHRAAIDAHFAALRAENPALFNGTLYLAADWRIDGGVFRARAFATDYASFLYWRDQGAPDASVRNFFGSGVLHASDGPIVLGIMGVKTANAGLIYPPSGSPEPEDVREGRMWLEENIAREIAEETGLVVGSSGPGEWFVIEDGPRIALMRRIDTGLSIGDLVRRVEAHIAGEAEPELAGVHVVRAISDVVPDRMPPYTQAYIRHAFAG